MAAPVVTATRTKAARAEALERQRLFAYGSQERMCDEPGHDATACEHYEIAHENGQERKYLNGSAAGSMHYWVPLDQTGLRIVSAA